MSTKKTAEEPSIVVEMGDELYEAMKQAHIAQIMMGSIGDASFGALTMAERVPALADQLRDVYGALAAARPPMMQVVNATLERVADLTAQRDAAPVVAGGT